MPRLMAEEELTLRAAVSHPYMEPQDQKAQTRRLLAAMGHVEHVRKATHADLESLGIKVEEH